MRPRTRRIQPQSQLRADRLTLLAKGLLLGERLVSRSLCRTTSPHLGTPSGLTLQKSCRLGSSGWLASRGWLSVGWHLRWAKSVVPHVLLLAGPKSQVKRRVEPGEKSSEGSNQVKGGCWQTTCSGALVKKMSLRGRLWTTTAGTIKPSLVVQMRRECASKTGREVRGAMGCGPAAQLKSPLYPCRCREYSPLGKEMSVTTF